MKNQIKVSGEIIISHINEATFEYRAYIKIAVGIFGIGGLIERGIAGELNKLLTNFPSYIQKYKEARL